MQKLKFGVELPQGGQSFKEIQSLANKAEELEYSSFFVNDHFFFSNEPYLECWTVLSSLISTTEKIRLGALVICNSYRDPALLAKMASTFDNLSGGRLEFCIGAGWHDKEYRAYGYPFPKPNIRVSQLEEAVQIIKAMWTKEKPQYKGKHYWINKAISYPKPVQKPHPPITIGVGHGKRILRLAAEHGNGFNKSGSPEEYAETVKRFDTYCMKANKNPSTMLKSVQTLLVIDQDSSKVAKIAKQNLKKKASYSNIKSALKNPGTALKYLSSMISPSNSTIGIVGTPDQCIRRVQKYLDAGANYIILTMPSVNAEQSIELFAKDVIPSFN